MDEQQKHLDKLRSDLMAMGGVGSAGVSFEDNPSLVQKGSFRTNLRVAEQFLLNLSSTFVIAPMEEFKQRDRTAFDQMLKRIAGLFVGLVHGVFKLSSERNSANGPMFRAPPIVKPSTIAKGGAFGFISQLMEQEERYLSTFDVIAKDQVETESEKFFSKYLHDKTFKQLVDNTDEAKTFDEAWGGFYKEFPMLVQFSGGMASILIGWEKDEYRTQLSNLSLEGALTPILLILEKTYLRIRIRMQLY